MSNLFNSQDPENVLTFSLAKHGWGFKLGEFFILGEAACKDGSDSVLVHPASILLLNTVRRKFGRTPVNSWYRTWDWNNIQGGGSSSKHPLGMATDINPPMVDPEEVALWAEELGIGGIGRYNTFTHLNVFGEDRRWDNRT